MNSENNNFILSTDSSPNSSDSVNINDLKVTGGVLHKIDELVGLSTATRILISDVAGLNKLSTLVNNDSFGFLGYTVILTADLDFTGKASTFNPIGKDNSKQFKGTFDGQGNTISNLSLHIVPDSGDVYAGLFGYLGSDATVKNLGMIDSEISATSTNNSAYSGGIAGCNEGTIKNCYNTGAVTVSVTVNLTDIGGFAYSGGIAGDNSGTIENCYNTGAVTVTDANNFAFTGGIAGENKRLITNCYNTGSITSTSVKGIVHSGGIAGQNYGYSGKVTIENCYNTGAVTTKSTAVNIGAISTSGGIAGYVFGSYGEATITNCYNTGNVTTTSTDKDAYSGGIAGWNDSNATITNCYNTGNVTATSTGGKAYSGGIAGLNTGTVMNCYYIGTVDDSIDGTTNLSEDAMKGLKLLSGTGENSTNLNKGQDPKPWSPDIFGVNNGYPILADVPLSIILGNSVPHSSVYLTFNDEAYQSENYLKPKVIIADTNNKLSVNLINLNTDLKVDTENVSYAWKKLGVKSFEDMPAVNTSSISTSSPADNETYQAVVTFNVKESEADSGVDYHYTSLSRTADVKYSVTYNANGGIGSKIENSYSSGDKVTILNNPFIAPEGKEFAGWSAESGTTTVDTQYAPGKSITINENINLYAVWKDIKYSVYYYYLNDNNKVIIDSNKSPGDTVNVKDTPVKSGYKFNHWLKYNYGDTSSNPETIQANATFQMPSSDVILIADWEKTSSGGSTSYVKQYSVIYVSDADISNVPYDSKSYTSGSSASVLKNNLSKEGFISNGWNTKADGTGTQYKEGDKVKITSSNIILYAQFKEDSPEPIGPDTPNSVSVTFYVDDKVYDTVYVIKGSCLENNMPDNPEKQNSTFKGWFYSDSEGNESEFSSESIVNNDMSIHAVFESNQDSNASSLSSSEIIIIIAVIALIAAALILYLFFFRKQ